ncbi:methyltransferase domain-containing protein [Moniliophthora roreri MCA 2997]|nr:methyltransferase domain-containing protein [Moniliophthora roreri MCA 2997]
MPEPDVSEGIAYWTSQPATIDGVLGGFGTGSLPRVDALGSRLFLLSLFPELSAVPSALRPLKNPSPKLPIRALDVGAGVGRVTRDVLLHLVPHVLLLEPVHPFIQEALSGARSSASDPSVPKHQQWTGLADKSKSVTFIQGTLQDCDPSQPLNPSSSSTKFLDRIGAIPSDGNSLSDVNSGFNVIWCQWCLGHLKDDDLVAFFKRSRNALRTDNGFPGRSLIVVKENCCSDTPLGEARTVFDDSDSSFTRSDIAWKDAFKKAGLRLVKEQVQEGLPDGLYKVKM